MALLGKTTIREWIGSAGNFISGLMGTGWRIWKNNGRWRMEVDELLVRGHFYVYEMIVSKMRAIIGSLGISQACGKVKSVREDADNYYVSVEDNNAFLADDFIRVQRSVGTTLKGYWVKVLEINSDDEIVIPKSEFETLPGFTLSYPAAGDDLVQYGNLTNTARQSAIYLHADENGTPAIDVLEGIKSKSFDGCVRVTIGGYLDGNIKKYGLLCINGQLKCVNSSGKTIYNFSPDGSFDLGKGKIKYNPVTDKLTFGEGIVLTWDNLSPEAQGNLKGEPGIDGKPGSPGAPGNDGRPGAPGIPGKDANLLDWVQDWDTGKTTIGSNTVISPKIFAGSTGASGPTGVAMGSGIFTIGGKEYKGLLGVKNGKPTFFLDSETGDAEFEGIIKAVGGKIGGFEITGGGLEAVDPESGDSMLLSNSLIRFISEYIKLYIGTYTLPASTGDRILSPEVVAINRTGDKYSFYGNIGKHITVEGATAVDDSNMQYTGNHAIFSPKGDVCGFRLRTRRITTNQTLSVMDSIVFLHTQNMNVTMPSDAEDGQLYIIKNRSGDWIRITAATGQSIEIGDNILAHWDHYSETVIIVYDAENKRWVAGYMQAI